MFFELYSCRSRRRWLESGLSRWSVVVLEVGAECRFHLVLLAVVLLYGLFREILFLVLGAQSLLFFDSILFLLLLLKGSNLILQTIQYCI